jgi:hypothetical protein
MRNIRIIVLEWQSPKKYWDNLLLQSVKRSTGTTVVAWECPKKNGTPVQLCVMRNTVLYCSAMRNTRINGM